MTLFYTLELAEEALYFESHQIIKDNSSFLCCYNKKHKIKPISVN
jgi:hypothetical protein